MGFQVRYLALFLLFSIRDGCEWLWMENLHKNIQLTLEFLKASFLVLHFSYYTLLTFLTMLPVILLSMLMILSFKCDQASDLWQQLGLPSELESDLQDIVNWGKKWLFNFNVGKTQLASFDQSDSNGSIDVKIDGSILEEKLFFKILRLTFSSKLDWGSYFISIAKTVSKKIRA